MSKRKKRLACEKCGSKDIYKRWHRTIDDCDLHWRHTLGHWRDPQGEHLHYNCRDCGFEWTGSVKGKER